MSGGRGRPRTGIGELGNVRYSPAAGGGFVAEGYTRDASGTRRRIQATGTTDADAHVALAARAAKLGVLVGQVTGSTTLGEMLDVWTREVVDVANTKPQTKRMYRTKAGRLSRRYGAIALEDLRPVRIQAIINELAAKHTPGEYEVLRATLNRTLNYAVLTEAIPANYIAITEKPRRKETKDPISLDALQLAVFRASFLAYAREGVRESNRRRAQLATELMVGLGGLRIGEVLAIRHRDVDLEANTVDVNGTVVYVPGQPVYRQNGLKADRQKRGLQLSPDGIGMRALREAIRECPVYRSGTENPILGRIEPDESVWMNPSLPSFHFDAVTHRPEVIAALAETKLTPADVTPHVLRRTVATLVARGEGEERAAEVLAHGDVRVTKGSYITPEGKVVNLHLLDGILSPR